MPPPLPRASMTMPASNRSLHVLPCRQSAPAEHLLHTEPKAASMPGRKSTTPPLACRRELHQDHEPRSPTGAHMVRVTSHREPHPRLTDPRACGIQSAR